MKATLNGVVVAEAPKENLVQIEGNWYFPPESVKPGVLVESPTPYTCPWKGKAQYYHLNDGETVKNDLAWGYPEPLPTSITRVGRDYSGYVAFDRKVKVSE